MTIDELKEKKTQVQKEIAAVIQEKLDEFTASTGLEVDYVHTSVDKVLEGGRLYQYLISTNLHIDLNI